jgi:hypothetical protein
MLAIVCPCFAGPGIILMQTDPGNGLTAENSLINETTPKDFYDHATF